jgi:exodeoxyribonuclease-5
MEFTKKQEEAIKLVKDRYLNKEKYTVISGYAGTGKSTIVHAIIESIPKIDPDKDVVFTSFTGKAVNVLKQKGNKNVSTLHRLLFEYHLTPEGDFIRYPAPFIPYKIVVVDEVSMVSNDLIDALFSYNIYVIFLGDPGQLPPIDKQKGNFLLSQPHVFFDQVMRQAAESEIIRYTMKIRNGETLPYGIGTDTMVLPANTISKEMLFWADIILCGTNNTRYGLNKLMRQYKEIDPNVLVAEGEKLICLQNYWDCIGRPGHVPLINGSIGYAKNVSLNTISVPGFIGVKNNEIPIVSAKFVSELNENFGTLNMDRVPFSKNESYLSQQQIGTLFRRKRYKKLIPKNFSYGYAITTHKAQGSQWGNVVIFEENFPFDRQEHIKWLYTAMTRAESKVVLLR